MPWQEGVFVFPDTDPVYTDHFPGAPVVPGTLIIQAFSTQILAIYPNEDFLQVRSFRFRHFVPPGRYSFSLKKQGDSFFCTLYVSGKPAVTGEIAIRK